MTKEMLQFMLLDAVNILRRVKVEDKALQSEIDLFLELEKTNESVQSDK